MKAEINRENKERFFTQYWGQNVLRGPNGPFVESVSYPISSRSYLQLKPLSSISDEDVIMVAKIAHELYRDMEWTVQRMGDIIHVVGGSSRKVYHISMIYQYATVNANITYSFKNEGKERVKKNIGQIDVSSACPVAYIAIVDYLRSKGYLVPWYGLSIDELIKAGWVSGEPLKSES